MLDHNRERGSTVDAGERDVVAATQGRCLGTHCTGRPAPRRKADDKADERERTAVLHSGADEHENHELRNHDEDVGEHVQHFVDPAAAETAEQADEHADGRRDDASHEAHVERGAQTSNQERHVVAAEVVGAEQVVCTGTGVRASHDVTGVDIHMVEQRSENCDQQRENENRDTHDEHRGLEKVS